MFSIELSGAHYCFYMREQFTYGCWDIFLPKFDFTGNSPNPKVPSITESYTSLRKVTILPFQDLFYKNKKE